MPLPAGLDQRLAKRTSLKSHQPSESSLSLAHLRHLCGVSVSLHGAAVAQVLEWWLLVGSFIRVIYMSKPP